MANPTNQLWIDEQRKASEAGRILNEWKEKRSILLKQARQQKSKQENLDL